MTVEGTAKLDFNGNGTASIKWEMAINAGSAMGQEEPMGSKEPMGSGLLLSQLA
jgi:predicted secreted protein